jgi:hypothetical protein
MPTFGTPSYSKVNNQTTGEITPSHVFQVTYNDSDKYLTAVANDSNDLSLNALQKCILENVTWWNDFIQQFLTSSSKFFSKQYTVQNINKITKHTLQGNLPELFPVNVSFIPKSIQIMNGSFYVNWEYSTVSMVIDIPVLEEELPQNTIELPDSNETSNMKELDIDELPEDKQSTDKSLPLSNSSKNYDKHRVKELQLKAKLAAYRAQHYLNKYYDQYGSDLSESDTDTENELSDEEDSEEIQL